LGNFNQARTYLEKSLALLGIKLPTSKWGIRLAILQALIIQTGHRLYPGRFIRSMDETADPKAEEMFKASLALGWIEGVSDVERLLLLTVSMLNFSESQGFAFGSTHLASTTSIAVDILGWHNQVDRYARLAEEYSRHIVPKRPLFQLEWGRALHHNIHGDFDKSLEHAQRAAEIAESTGDLRSYGSAMDLTSWAHLTHGRLAEALETCQEMIEIAEEGSDLQVICWGFLGLGVTRKRLGQLDQAILDLEHAIEIAQQVPDFHTQVAASGWLGRCLVAKGELAEAITRLEASQGILLNQGIVMEIAILGNGLSEAYLAATERSPGEEKQEWLKKAKRSCRDSLRAAKRYRPPLIDAQMLQGRYEWLRGKTTTAEKWWGRALAESQRMRDRYAEGMVNLEIGRRSGDRKHLQQAVSILEEIGSEFDLAAAREASANLRGN
jgi:tetratricopeptide (TPR) repeat protein